MRIRGRPERATVAEVVNNGATKKEKRTEENLQVDYLEKRVRDGLVEDRIPDAGNPLVNEIDDARLAGHDELLILRRRLDPISIVIITVKDHFHCTARRLLLY